MDPGGNTLHLCVDSRCLIFQISRADSIPPNFRKFLLNGDCKFAGFWNKWHRKKLADSKHGLLMYAGSFNLRWIEPSLRDEWTEEIIHKGLGFKVERSEQAIGVDHFSVTIKLFMLALKLTALSSLPGTSSWVIMCSSNDQVVI
ncbi:uncharacterized protein LOC123921996 [Trifolium pratense]|uniref:uncharacterized protein LOC123921996 n=1 Tax=Trifolium pratense TaxID=57577 RepID=UPI001E697F77|nr:uncharacterized protein LOC123921996 [Trifolium pratense]